MALKKQEILVISELFLPTKGGTAIWFDEVYRRLGAKNIHIVTAKVPDCHAVDSQHPNSIYRVDLRRVWWLRPESLGMYVKLFALSLRVALKARVVAIHAGRVLPEGLIALLVGKLLRKKVVIYAHGEEITTWRQAMKFRVMCFTYRHADTVIANSEFTHGELLKLAVDKKSIVTIYPGVDIHRFMPGLNCTDLRLSLGMDTGQHLILSVGRLSRRKGFDQVIKAIPLLLKAGLDVRYALIGIGDDLDYLKNLAKELGVFDRVYFLGHVEACDLPRWYNACDIFAMPNREIEGDTEGFGLVFLEAAACGKPSIAGLAGGTGSAVLDGKTGLRVDGESLERVAEGIVRLLSDKTYRLEQGEQAMKRARAEFSWEAVASRTEERVA